MMELRKVDRRGFLETLVGAGALLLTARWAPASAQEGAFDPSIYLSIEPDGRVTCVVHRSEMGQGIRSTLAAVLADELDADLARVRIVQAPGDETRYGDQNTDGSHSIRDFYVLFRQSGAALRVMLETAAARRWKVPQGEVAGHLGEVVHARSGRRVGYGELAAAARAVPVPKPAELVLKSPDAFRYQGRPIPNLDAADMTCGRAQYGIDVVVPGMRYAVMARPPVHGGKVRTVKDEAARAVRGVEEIVRLEGPASLSPSMVPVGGVAVVAGNTWTAKQGRDRLEIEWDDGPNAVYESTAYQAELAATARRAGRVVRAEGDVDAALARAARRLTADYMLPHLVHAAMEPLVATAHVTADGCEVWAPTQDPEGMRGLLATTLGLPRERVTVHVTLLGGGFGRKAFHDFGVEAALVSRKIGKPVKLQWTREDDMAADFYHTVAAHHCEAGLDAQGRVIGWLHRAVYPSINTTFDEKVDHPVPYELAQGMVDLPFDIANVRLETGAAKAHTRIGWFRSVNNIHQAFAIQCFADEIAHALGRDPLQNMRDMLGAARIVKPTLIGKEMERVQVAAAHAIDTARHRRVLDVAAESAGWGRKMPRGRGMGLAVHRSFNSYCAAVVEVAVAEDGTVTIPQVDMALDCGFAVNPDRVKAQCEGAAVMGLSLVAYGAVTFSKGRAEQTNFHQFPLARMDAAPRKVNVHLVNSGRPLGGVGEPPMPPIAPALCNAIFAATGRRIRTLPVGQQLAPAT